CHRRRTGRRRPGVGSDRDVPADHEPLMITVQRSPTRRWSTVLLLFLLASTLVTALTSCTAVNSSAPTCQGVQRLPLVAQSVPGASFVPCIQQLPAGWAVHSLQIQRGGTDYSLLSDRAAGHAVRVRLASACDLAGATPTDRRAPGVRSYLHLTSINPRY